MKRITFLLMVVMACVAFAQQLLAQSQQVVIQQNTPANPTGKTDDGSYYINGISTRENIGGVEVSRGEFKGYSGNKEKYNLKFSNYNNIPVSVIYQVFDDSDGEVTGSIVLQAGQTRLSDDTYVEPNNYKIIARPLATAEATAPSYSISTQNTVPQNSTDNNVSSNIISNNGQQVVIQQNTPNNPTGKTDDGSYYINGISTRENIGGVEVSRGEFKGYSGNKEKYNLKFSNYNNIPVSVIYQVFDDSDGEVTGSIVLQPGQTRLSDDIYVKPNNYKIIARPLVGGSTSIQLPQTISTTGIVMNGNQSFGIINSLTALTSMNEYKQAQTELDYYVKDCENQIQSYRQLLENKVNEYKRAFSESTKTQLANELQNLSEKIATLKEESTFKINNKQQELMAPLQTKVKNAIYSVAGKKGLIIVFEYSEPLFSNLNQVLDITDDVIQELL